MRTGRRDARVNSMTALSTRQGSMFSRSTRRLGCVGSQPSVFRVYALEEGWFMAKIGPRGPYVSSGTASLEGEPEQDRRVDGVYGRTWSDREKAGVIPTYYSAGHV